MALEIGHSISSSCKAPDVWSSNKRSNHLLVVNLPCSHPVDASGKVPVERAAGSWSSWLKRTVLSKKHVRLARIGQGINSHLLAPLNATSWRCSLRLLINPLGTCWFRLCSKISADLKVKGHFESDVHRFGFRRTTHPKQNY